MLSRSWFRLLPKQPGQGDLRRCGLLVLRKPPHDVDRGPGHAEFERIGCARCSAAEDRHLLRDSGDNVPQLGYVDAGHRSRRRAPQHHPIARPSLLALLLHLQAQGRAHDADGRSATGAAA
jgi:hypothetical protein